MQKIILVTVAVLFTIAIYADVHASVERCKYNKWTKTTTCTTTDY